MFTTTDPFNRKPVRTCRGEMPDKKRHPQSWNSADVMVGFRETYPPLYYHICSKLQYQASPNKSSNCLDDKILVACGWGLFNLS